MWISLEPVERGMGGTIEIVGGLWVLLISWAALRTGMFPKALSYTAIVISVSAFATIVPAFELVGAVCSLGLIVWLVWLGVIMYRSGPRAPTEMNVQLAVSSSSGRDGHEASIG